MFFTCNLFRPKRKRLAISNINRSSAEDVEPVLLAGVDSPAVIEFAASAKEAGDANQIRAFVQGYYSTEGRVGDVHVI